MKSVTTKDGRLEEAKRLLMEAFRMIEAAQSDSACIHESEDLVDMTTMGSENKVFLCSGCGETLTLSWEDEDGRPL